MRMDRGERGLGYELVHYQCVSPQLKLETF
jgi:hypothetical protein